MTTTEFWPIVHNGRPMIAEARFGSVDAAVSAAEAFLASPFAGLYTDFVIYEHAGIYGPLFEVAFTITLAA